MAAAHPKAVRQLPATRPCRNHSALEPELDPARTNPTSQELMNDHAPDQVLCRLIAYTAQTLNVTPDQIVSSKRERELVLARSIIADIAYSDFLYNYCQIGKALNRNHTTIMHNVKVLAKDIRHYHNIGRIREKVLNTYYSFLQQ